MPERLTLADAHAGWRWLRWRLSVFGAVFGLGLLALSSGAGVSDRVLDDAGLATRMYYTLGLFVFGGLDLGTPRGEPAWAVGLLWCVYFAAPAITTGAVVEAVLRAIEPRAFWLRRTHGHAVVIGCGRLAQVYLTRLRALHPRGPVIVVDRDAQGAISRQLGERLRVRIVHGDAADPSLIDVLRLQHADRVALLTGDDLVNLDAAARIAAQVPRLAGRTLVHVADLRLLRVIERQRLLPDARLFNSYRTAARHLVETHLLPHFASTAGIDSVVIAGFGRYGQTVLDELQKRAAGQLARLVIVDLEAERRAAVFAEQVGFLDGDPQRIVQADLRDPRTWSEVDALLDGAPHPVFVLCSGDDGLNIRAALRLSPSNPRPFVVARCFHGSAFTRAISREVGFEIVSTSELLAAHLDREGLADPPDGQA